ncbi:type II toxin-antitoxin system RelE family toxin [Nostoc sp. UHCC 0252]|nr:type II toxin-antitoxin system RelE/ParE family toxin [Nostoc sp. UHCC 0252]MEA5602450.1 type II toxin-antitoxin system RelE/ParE family toxin [Nostoc sp. UHCC 0252]
MVKLKGFDNEYRIRIGDYRVRYEIDDENQLIQILQCNGSVRAKNWEAL